MPWKPQEAEEHTHKANTPKKRRMWADVADSALARGSSEGSAIRQANAVAAGTARHVSPSKRRK